MTENTFRQATELLTGTYGTSAYPATRLTIIWDEVKGLDDKWFMERVRDWCGSRMKPLVLSDCKTLVLEKRELDWEEQKKIDREKLKKGLPARLKEMAVGARNQEFIQKCIWLFTAVWARRIDKIKFWNYCDDLERLGAQLADNSECQRCHNSGLEFSEDSGHRGRIVHRCICEIGGRMAADFEASQKKTEYPVSLTMKPYK